MEGLILLLLVIGIWVGFGLWGKAVMTPKGYSPAAGFFIGAIGGIFGIIVAYVMPEKK